MTNPLAPPEQSLEAVRAAWEGARPAFNVMAGDAQVQIEQMSDSGVVAVTDAIAAALQWWRPFSTPPLSSR